VTFAEIPQRVLVASGAFEALGEDALAERSQRRVGARSRVRVARDNQKQRFSRKRLADGRFPGTVAFRDPYCERSLRS